jgi:hypothetical protein
MQLPIVTTKAQDLSLVQTKWAAILNPVIALPLTQGTIIPNVSLVSGKNVINHSLGRNLMGWILVRVRASATFYDTQDSNPFPSLTLWLEASAASVVDLYVF